MPIHDLPQVSANLQPNATANTDDFEFEALQEAANYRRSIVKAFSSYLSGNVIEIGAGIGQMTNEFKKLPSISRLLPVEPDPIFCEQHTKNVPGHELLSGIIQDVPSDVAWDAIVSINVLEHIQADEIELAQYREKLAAKKGYICLLVPARPEIYSQIDKDFGHFRRYTKTGLRKRLEAANFDVVSLEYFNLAGYFAWFWTFKILGARHFSQKQVRFFDQKIFPVTQWLESKIPLPIGQSLLAVARAV